MIENFEWPLLGMTLDEAAKALRVDSKTIRTLIKAGDFPARKVGKGWRIDPDAVKRWLDTTAPKEPVSGPAPGWYEKAREAAKEEQEQDDTEE